MSAVTIKIVSRWNWSCVLYEHQSTAERQASGLAMRDALEAAVKARANLADANLADADLARANLARANLAGANLARANLAGANLAGAYLAGANLADADLARANLAGAYLADAYLADADRKKVQLVGNRPLLTVGPIGSRSGTASLWLTDAGPLVRAGCFWASLDVFAAAVDKTHGDSVHGREYRAAIALMRVHVECWTPVAEVA